MRDVSLDELADEMSDELEDQGIHISRILVRRLVKAWFSHVEKIIAEGEKRFSMYNRDIAHIYPIIDVKGLCDELAAGEKFVLTVDYLIRKNKLSKRVARHLNYRSRVTMDEKALA